MPDLDRPPVAVDAQLMHGTPTGIGEYLHGLLPALQANGTAFDALSEPAYDPWRFDRRVIWDQAMLLQRARPYRLLHCTSGTLPFARRAATLVTVHDVAWLRVQQHARFYARAYFGNMMLAAYRRAAAIVTVSEFSRQELLSFGGFDEARVHAIHPGVSDDFAQVVRRTNDHAPVILAIGTVERRKNLAVVIRALAAMRSGSAVLVSCGPPTPYLDECRKLAHDLGVAERVQFRGYVSRQRLLDYYASATVAVMPSLYEGFGLGAAQALVAGVPLCIARSSSLIEIAPDAAHVLDTNDPTAWTEALDTVIEQKVAANRQAEQVQRAARERFSWIRAAQRISMLYNVYTTL